MAKVIGSTIYLDHPDHRCPAEAVILDFWMTVNGRFSGLKLQLPDKITHLTFEELRQLDYKRSKS